MTTGPGESRETRLRRLRMRSMRRGTKEMDILLIRFAEARLDALDAAGLDAYEALLAENDQDLYQWISGQRPAPEVHAPMISEISRIAANG
ncbi:MULTISPECIES: succinate dehydrogenase assembly factor 2 [unclassified Mameliella]|uniref:FAD assembly factor SdhE n=1 Tax=unclassified Mameliella TaxID=2630630 RepID=UPI00273DA677|nr:MULTISPECIES: succinate dehydrogenase assembly factor 2 [unclassified Mameliella]